METSTWIAAILPAVTSFIMILASTLTCIGRVKDVVGDTKKSNKRIAEHCSNVEEKLEKELSECESVINELAQKNEILIENFNDIKRQNEHLLEQNLLLKSEVESIEEIKKELAVTIRKLNKGD